MVNNRVVSFLLSMFLIAILLSAQVAASIFVIGATEAADPVDPADTIEFVADVLTFDGETTSTVVLTIDSTPYPMTLTGSNYTLSLAASILGLGTFTYDVTATGSAGNITTLSSDVTVGDLVDPTIDAESVPLTVCYGDDIGVFASVSDNVAVSFVAINIDGTDYPLSDLVGDPTYNYAEAIPSTPFGISSLVYNMYAEDSSGNFDTGSPGFIDVYDCIPPTISGVTESADPVEYGSTITITADVTDDISNVDSVILTVGSTSYTMTPSGSTYTASVPTTGMTLGLVSYTITATDDSDAANEATATGDFTIEDTTAPVITVLGSNPTTVEAGTTYTDAGATALDNYDGDITSSISTTNPVNTAVLGTYTVTYTVSDSSGNSDTETRTVTVVDTIAPVLTVLGSNPTTVEAGTTYTDAGATATDSFEGDLTSSISTTNPVNTAVLGTYTVTYTVSDSSGNSDTATRTVTVVDTIDPVITVLGSNPTTVEAGTTYTDAGATATDSFEGDLTSSISTTNPVNTAVLGTYTVTYTVSDSSGNSDTETRTVTVVDTEDPILTVLGSDPVTVEVGSTYADAGATAVDSFDGDLTTSIVTFNPVNTAVLGTYTVTYAVTDSSGNSDTATRTVIVVDTTIPVISLLGSTPETVEVGSTYTDAGATALDNYDGDITTSIVTTSDVDTSIVGFYTVTYDVTDSSGNDAVTVTRDVEVVDTTIPVISLLGSTPETVEVGSTYTDAGATALDNYDGDITISIVTVNPVDTSVVGTYTVTYDVTDSEGNDAVQVTRTVNVVDTTAPSIDSYSVDPTDIPEIGDSVTIIATVTDNDAVSTVVVDVEGTVYTMTNTGGDTYESSSIDTASLGLGVQSYTITATDVNSLTDTESDIFVVIDSVDPVINSIADTPDPVEFGGDVTFTADVTDDNGVDSVELTIDGATYTMSNSGGSTYGYVLDSSVLSVATFSYSVTATDTFSNEVTDSSGSLTVADSEAPVITMFGSDPETVEAATTYTDAGATATDNVDGDLTSEIVTINNVNTAIVGVYEVTYNVTDSAGNMANETRIVIVSDTTAPIITVLGNNPETVQLGAAYTDAGATATDSLDGDLTSSISTSGTVDTAILGTYTITYTISDSSGNSDVETRTVNVVDTTAPTMSTSVSPNPVDQDDPVTFSADVTDNDAVSTVELTINGVTNPMPNTGGSTYEYILDTTGMALGYYPYTIVATDSSGNTVTATGTLRITIVSPMTVHINADKTSGEEDLDVSLASYVDAGGVAPFTYVWDFGDGDDTDSNKNVRHVFTKDGTYIVTLRVYDQYGNEGTDSVTITVTDEETNNNPRNNIKLDDISLASDVVEAGDVLEAFVNIENIGQSRLEGISLTIVIPDLGLVATSTAEDIRTGDADEFSVALDIPEDVPPGVYDVRIIVSNDEMKRVKHRDIVIE